MAPERECSPSASAFSRTPTLISVPRRCARFATSMAHASPAGPAPTMRTSSSMRSPAPAAPSWRMSLSSGSGNWYWAGTILSMQLADLFGQSRNDFEQVAHHAVIGNFENRRVLVLVDRDDHFRRPHAGQMLDHPGDPDGDVQRGAHRLPCLADLIGVRAPSQIT